MTNVMNNTPPAPSRATDREPIDALLDALYHAHVAGQRVHDLRVDTVTALAYASGAVEYVKLGSELPAHPPAAASPAHLIVDGMVVTPGIISGLMKRNAELEAERERAAASPEPGAHVCSKSGLPMHLWEFGPCPGCQAEAAAPRATEAEPGAVQTGRGWVERFVSAVHRTGRAMQEDYHNGRYADPDHYSDDIEASEAHFVARLKGSLEVAAPRADATAGGAAEELDRLTSVHAFDEWHEDFGDVLWWTAPITEPPCYVGTPLDNTWPFENHTNALVWCRSLSPATSDSALRAAQPETVETRLIRSMQQAVEIAHSQRAAQPETSGGGDA